MNASRRFGNTSGASLRFEGLDPEARIGLPVGPGTTPGQLSTLLLTVLLCLCIYLPLLPFRPEEGAEPAVWSLGWVWKQLTAYKGIPVPVVAFTMWCLAFLFIKTLKIRAQRAAIGVSILPTDAAFVLNATTSDAVVDRIDGIADRPDRFIYLARVRGVLRSMRNLGRVSDVDELLGSRADDDDSIMDSGYVVAKGLIWAIPVLGFIGTVLGLTDAMGKFGKTLAGMGKQLDSEQLMVGLKDVLGGLDTAFITTFEALLAVLVIQLVMVWVRRMDESLHADIRSACAQTIVSRVRLGAKES